MRKFGTIHLRFWRHDNFKRLPDAPKLLAVYLLTGPHSNSLGAFALPIKYIEADLKWSEEKVAENMAALSACGFVLYDPAVEWALLPKYIKWNRPRNSKAWIGIMNLLSEMPCEFKHRPAAFGAVHKYADADNKTPADVKEFIAAGVKKRPGPKKSKPKKKAEWAADDPRHALSDILKNLILKNNPSAKVNARGWPAIVDKMIRLDGRPPAGIKARIVFSQTDEFWQKTCLSMDSIRKHYDRFTLEISGGAGKESSTAAAGKVFEACVRSFEKNAHGRADFYNDLSARVKAALDSIGGIGVIGETHYRDLPKLKASFVKSLAGGKK